MKAEYTKYILQNYESARSDDNLLIFYHLRRIGIYLTPQQLRTLQASTKATVSIYDLVRYRQKIQSPADKLYDPKLQATKEVVEKRHKSGRIRTKIEQSQKEIISKPKIVDWDYRGNTAIPIYG
ncbi:MAG: hypothetical protein KGI58_04045 [Patescibacteria group bacterium]|nr:hypothetical protein [Patescibacteria group bacterium]